MSLGINWSTSKMLQSTTVTATKLTDHLALVTGWSQGGHKGGHKGGHRVVTGWSCGGRVGVMGVCDIPRIDSLSVIQFRTLWVQTVQASCFKNLTLGFSFKQTPIIPLTHTNKLIMTESQSFNPPHSQILAHLQLHSKQSSFSYVLSTISHSTANKAPGQILLPLGP